MRAAPTGSAVVLPVCGGGLTGPAAPVVLLTDSTAEQSAAPSVAYAFSVPSPFDSSFWPAVMFWPDGMSAQTVPPGATIFDRRRAPAARAAGDARGIVRVTGRAVA